MKCHIEHSNYITQFDTLTPLDELARVHLPHGTEQKEQIKSSFMRRLRTSFVDVCNKQVSLTLGGEAQERNRKNEEKISSSFFQMP